MGRKPDTRASVEIAASQNENGTVNLALMAKNLRLHRCSERSVQHVIDRNSVAEVTWDGVPLRLRVTTRIIATVTGSAPIEAKAMRMRMRILEKTPRIG